MRINTPCHIINLDCLMDNLSGPIFRIRKEASCNILFAIKGFSSPEVLSFMHDYIDGISSSGLFESMLGREHIGKYVCTYSPAYKQDEFVKIVNHSNSIIFNSIEQFKMYNLIAKSKNCSCGIRINPQLSFFSDSYKVNPCQKFSRLGIPIEYMPSVNMFDKGKIEGIHLHVMCEQYEDDLELVVDMLINNYEPYLKRIKWLNLGGGQIYSDNDYHVDKAIESIKKLQRKFDLNIYLEPCTGIMINCGYFVTTVLDIVKNGMDIAIIDGSAVCHFPDVVFDDWKHNILGAKEPGTYDYDYRIAGPSCYPGDIWGDYSFTKPLSIGDKIVFENTAMYSMVKSNFFNGINLPSIEVFFVEDNIWTMDGDGELRLTIMATLAQEESRKVSERVKAGQQISRMNGTIYGCGNILGYDRVGSTYVKNPEQAETVRMIFEMYIYKGMGTTAISNELIRLKRLNASGINKWSAGVICRVLNNPTYMGYMAYGKSYSNNYLEQKRINNTDSSTYMYVKADFEPIVTEDEWHKCQEIKSKRVSTAFKDANEASKKKRNHGIKENKDLWGSKLRCPCGFSFRKNRWHKNKNKPWSYGYQCYNQLNNGSASTRKKVGADTEGYCDQPMIADWKLEMMAQRIFEQIWKERKEAVDSVCDLIKKCYQTEKPQKINLTGISSQIERLRKKKNTLLEMRTDGELTKEEYMEQKEKLDKSLNELTEEYDSISADKENTGDFDLRWDEIRASLEEMIDFSSSQIDRNIIRKFVAKIVPNGKNHFRWYMNLDKNETTTLDMVVEGRKNNPVICFDEVEDEEEKPPLHKGVAIKHNELRLFLHNLLNNEEISDIISKKLNCSADNILGEPEKTSNISMLHRQLSKANS